MEFLIAADLEGVHGVLGEPYKTLTDTPDYKVACDNAVKEINVVVEALFNNGASKVSVWDNHGAKQNLDFSKIDERVERVDAKAYKGRLEFAKDHDYKGIIYIGYHPKEGTLGGVLAHTYCSTSIQYAKINGKQVGELDIDSYIAGAYGIPPLFCASDDKAVAQMLECSPLTETVITKFGKSRNTADLREPEEVLKEIYDGVSIAVKKGIKPVTHEFPAHVEVRYFRAETAELRYNQAKEKGIPVHYGEDGHILHYIISSVFDVKGVL